MQWWYEKKTHLFCLDIADAESEDKSDFLFSIKWRFEICLYFLKASQRTSLPRIPVEITQIRFIISELESLVKK